MYNGVQRRELDLLDVSYSIARYTYFEYITNKHKKMEVCLVQICVNEIAHIIAFKNKIIIYF